MEPQRCHIHQGELGSSGQSGKREMLKSCSRGRGGREKQVGLKCRTPQKRKSGNQTLQAGILMSYNQLMVPQVRHTRLRGWTGYTE